MPGRQVAIAQNLALTAISYARLTGHVALPHQGCNDDVVPGYIEAMGMHLREGRDLSWSDRADSEHVVLLNEAAARRLWPGQNPLGRIAEVGGNGARVVGVVSNVPETSVEDSSGPEVYVPVTQDGPVGAELVVRSKLRRMLWLQV
jgi:hypothetical protein